METRSPKWVSLAKLKVLAGLHSFLEALAQNPCLALSGSQRLPSLPWLVAPVQELPYSHSASVLTPLSLTPTLLPFSFTF